MCHWTLLSQVLPLSIEKLFDKSQTLFLYCSLICGIGWSLN